MTAQSEHQIVVDAVNQALADLGAAAYDPTRLRGALTDLLGNHARSSRALVAAVVAAAEDRVPSALAQGAEARVLAARLAAGGHADAAAPAVAVWAAVVRRVPQSQTEPGGEGDRPPNGVARMMAAITRSPLVSTVGALAVLGVLALVIGMLTNRADDNLPTRNLGEVTKVPSLLDEPRAQSDVNIRDLVTEQFEDSIEVFESFDSTFAQPELLLLDKDAGSGAIARRCGVALEAGDAFYCPPENAVYLDLGWLDDFSRRSVEGKLRDGAVLATVAHELGHAWYGHVGFVDRTQSIQPEELYADCIAGAVIAEMYSETADAVSLIQEAAEDAYSVGTYDWQNPGFHGTPAQRRDATLRGGRSGVRGCDVYVT